MQLLFPVKGTKTNVAFCSIRDEGTSTVTAAAVCLHICFDEVNNMENESDCT